MQRSNFRCNYFGRSDHLKFRDNLVFANFRRVRKALFGNFWIFHCLYKSTLLLKTSHIWIFFFLHSRESNYLSNSHFGFSIQPLLHAKKTKKVLVVFSEIYKCLCETHWKTPIATRLFFRKSSSALKRKGTYNVVFWLRFQDQRKVQITGFLVI